MGKMPDEVKRLRDGIQAALDALPDFDIFDKSNAEDKEFMRRLVADLERVMKGQGSRMHEVSSWLEGPDHYLIGDFLA